MRDVRVLGHGPAMMMPALLLALLAACSSPGATQDTASAADATSPGDTASTDVSDAVPREDAADATSSPDTGPAPVWELPPPTTLGGKRPAALRLPPDYDGSQALPVILLLGGYWNLASDLDDWIDLSGRVAARAFALVLPDGTVDSDGAPFWNATDTCCDYDGSGVDDVKYLTKLLDELAAKVHIDPARVAFVGHSNGGFMAYRMACELPRRVAAVASLAGSGFLDASDCHADAPVSILQVHGLEDDVMPFGGDDEAPGALEMMSRWGARAGCDLGSFGEDPDRYELVDDGVPDETTVARFHAGCDAAYDLQLWELSGNGHYPEFRPAFTERLLDWVLARSRPR